MATDNSENGYGAEWGFPTDDEVELNHREHAWE